MFIQNFISNIADFLYSICFFNVATLFNANDINLPLVALIMLIGFVYTTLILNFIQFRKLKNGFNHIFASQLNVSSSKKISPIKTMFTAIASSTGLGGTAGVAGTIMVAGPGVVFWIPIVIFLTMALRFCEIYLSHKNKPSSSTLGGPFIYMKVVLSDLGFKKFGSYVSLCYAIIMAMCGLFAISLFEINQAVQIATNSFTILHNQEFIVGLFCITIVGYVIFGGSQRISTFFGTMMPILVTVFLVISLFIVFSDFNKLINALNIIFEDAMNPKAAIGGIVGSFIACLRRIAMSSETGLGTSGIVHSSSSEINSKKEALSGMIAPIISGFFISFMTALVIIITGVYKGGNGDGIILLANAFGTANKYFPLILTIMIPIMAINVTIGWSFYGIKCIEYIFGNKKYVKLYLIAYLIFGFSGSFINDFQIIIKIVDSSVMFLVMINVPIIILAVNKIRKEIK